MQVVTRAVLRIGLAADPFEPLPTGSEGLLCNVWVQYMRMASGKGCDCASSRGCCANKTQGITAVHGHFMADVWVSFILTSEIGAGARGGIPLATQIKDDKFT